MKVSTIILLKKMYIWHLENALDVINYLLYVFTQ